jgi:hypothetical protein
VGEVDRVVLVGTGGDLAEGAGVEDLAAAERGEPDITVALTAIDTARAEA